MALPRTHDGSVGPRSTSSTLLPILSAVFSVAIVACLIVLGIRYADTSGSFGDRVGQVFSGTDDAAAAAADDPRTRELVMSQANQFMIRINTYGPSDLDDKLTMPGYVDRVDEVITPKFSVDFEKSVTYAEQTVSQAGLSRSVQLYATGLESLDADLASVLVTGVITQSYPDPANDKGRIEFEPLQFRYEVSLVKTEGTWLVDDFTPVRGEVEGEPTPGVPTGEPTSPSTVDPTGDPTGSPVQQRYVEIVSRRRDSLSVAINALDTCSFPLAATAGDTTCVEAPAAVGASARTLVASLQGAANPDSKVYVGTPPAPIAELVDTTRAAAQSVVATTGALGADCVTSDSASCSTQRNEVTRAINELIAALDGWAAVS